MNTPDYKAIAERLAEAIKYVNTTHTLRLLRGAKNIPAMRAEQDAFSEAKEALAAYTAAKDADASTSRRMLFCELPLGTRFRYPGGDTIWTIVCQWREEPEGPLHGTLAEWRPDMLDLGRWPGQKICSYIPGECPAHVEAIS